MKKFHPKVKMSVANAQNKTLPVVVGIGAKIEAVVVETDANVNADADYLSIGVLEKYQAAPGPQNAGSILYDTYDFKIVTSGGGFTHRRFDYNMHDYETGVDTLYVSVSNVSGGTANVVFTIVYWKD